MQSPLVPADDIEVQVKPEKIYATVIFMPQFFFAFLIAAFAITFLQNLFCLQNQAV